MNFIPIVLPCLIFIFTSGNSDWKLRKDDAGVEIYTRSIEGSAFQEFKGVITVENTSLYDALEVILDVKNYTDLYPDCIEAKILYQEGKYYDIHYFNIRAPWPVKNRDAVYESTTTVSDDGRYAKVSLKPVGDYIKENEESVRMYNGSGFWEVEEDNNKNTRITYQFHADPGGEIPAWLANSVVVSNPYKTLQNLRNKINQFTTSSKQE